MWTDLYRRNWHALTQEDVDLFEAAVKMAIPDIQVGELSNACDSLKHQDDPPQPDELIQNIKAIRDVGYKRDDTKFTCPLCRDTGTLRVPCWYAMQSSNIMENKPDKIVNIGYEVSQKALKKYGKDALYFLPDLHNPCNCDQGKERAQRWYPHTSPHDLQQLYAIADKAALWLDVIRSTNKDPDMMPNGMKGYMDGNVARMSKEKIEKPERKPKRLPQGAATKAFPEPKKPLPCLEDELEKQHGELYDW